MSTLDELIDSLAVELEALSVARQEYKNSKTLDAPREWEKLGDARKRVEDVQEKINDAAPAIAEKRADEMEAKKLETEGDEITPDALLSLGFVECFKNVVYTKRPIDRNRIVAVHYFESDGMLYISVGGEPMVTVFRVLGVKTLADLKALYRLVTGETLV